MVTRTDMAISDAGKQRFALGGSRPVTDLQGASMPLR
jgi:hypothetical protein